MRTEKEVKAMVARLENFIQKTEQDDWYMTESAIILGKAHCEAYIKELIHDCRQEICLLNWVLEPTSEEGWVE